MLRIMLYSGMVLKHRGSHGRRKVDGMTKKDARNRILDAAERVLAHNSLVNTTIDTIAIEAKMSKGGVLHYFATKRALLLASLSRFEERLFALREEMLAVLPDTPCRRARATIMAVMEMRKRTGHSGPYRIDLLEDRHYRQMLSDMKMRLFSDIFSRARHPEKMLVAMYLMDGLWLNAMFSPRPISGKMEDGAMKWLTEYLGTLYGEYE